MGIVFLIGFIYAYFPKETKPPKVYRIAVDKTWYPLSLLNENEYVMGFTEEITQKIASEQHLPIELMQVGPENLFRDLDMGEYDGILSSLRAIEARDENYIFSTSNIIVENTESYIFSKPYYLLGPVILVSSSSNIKSVKDLSGKRIGVLNGYESISLSSKGITQGISLKRFDNTYNLIINIYSSVFTRRINPFEFFWKKSRLDA